MGDVYKEQLVRRVPSAKDAVIKAAIIAAGFFIFAVAYMLIYEFAMLVLAVVGFLIYYAFGAMKIEYEYILTNGSLDIDCIYNKSRRKSVFSGDVKEFYAFAPLTEAGTGKEFDAADVVRDCTSGVPEAKKYVFVAYHSKKRVKIIFEPNEIILSAMRPYIGKSYTRAHK